MRVAGLRVWFHCRCVQPAPECGNAAKSEVRTIGDSTELRMESWLLSMTDGLAPGATGSAAGLLSDRSSVKLAMPTESCQRIVRKFAARDGRISDNCPLTIWWNCVELRGIAWQKSRSCETFAELRNFRSRANSNLAADRPGWQSSLAMFCGLATKFAHSLAPKHAVSAVPASEPQAAMDTVCMPDLLADQFTTRPHLA